MNSSIYFNHTDQERAVPVPRRLHGPSEQSYQYQLGINVSEMLDRCLAHTWPVKILDIWGYHALATSDMIDSLSPKWKSAEVTIIDLPEDRNKKVKRSQNTVFLGWDLNDELFLKSLTQSIPKQQVMFMNQVTQYLHDRLGVIKFFFDEMLETEGSFYVNILSESFIQGSNFPESLIFEAMEHLWEEAPGVSLKKSQVSMWRKITHQYQLRKTSEDARLPVPTLKYSKDDPITESLIYVKSAYNFLEIRE